MGLKHPNPAHPFNQPTFPNKSIHDDWSLLEFEDMLAFFRHRGIESYSVFKRTKRLFTHCVDKGWILHLLPYLSHNAATYREAHRLHARAMTRIQRKQSNAVTSTENR